MAYRIMWNTTLQEIIDDLKSPDTGLFVDLDTAKANRDNIERMRQKERLNPNYHQYYHDHNKRRLY
jgi:hypothetical protein